MQVSWSSVWLQYNVRLLFAPSGPPVSGFWGIGEVFKTGLSKPEHSSWRPIVSIFEGDISSRYFGVVIPIRKHVIRQLRGNRCARENGLYGAVLGSFRPIIQFCVAGRGWTIGTCAYLQVHGTVSLDGLARSHSWPSRLCGSHIGTCLKSQVSWQRLEVWVHDPHLASCIPSVCPVSWFAYFVAVLTGFEGSSWTSSTP